MLTGKKFLAFFGAFICTLPLLMAPTGGLPSRPTFQQLTAASGTIPQMIVKGAASGTSSVNYISFRDSANTVMANVGDASAGDTDFYINAAGANSGIQLLTSGTGFVQINSNRVPRFAFGRFNGATGALVFGVGVSGSRSGTGTYAANITAAAFTSGPVCTVTTESSSNTATINTPTATNVDVFTRVPSTLAAQDANYDLLCMGT